MVRLHEVRRDPEVRAMVAGAERHLAAIGFTEHGFRHAGVVARAARLLLQRLGHSPRVAELAAIAGYLHDIGNVASRVSHGPVGASLALGILSRLGMVPSELAEVAGAIGNHEDGSGEPVNVVSAALILADKADVRRSRVRDRSSVTDIHDRVNVAVTRRRLEADPDRMAVALKLEVDTTISPVMEYFETFLWRMLMCRRAATFLDCRFELTINEVRLL